MFRTLSLGKSTSVALRKLLQGGRRWSWAIHKFATKEQPIRTTTISCQVKEFSILCMGRCKPLGSLSSFLSYVFQLSGANLFPSLPCFLHSPAPQQLLWVEGGEASTGSQFQERSFSFGGQKSIMAVSRLLIWQEIFSFHRANLSGCLWLTVLLMSMFGLIQGPSCCVHLLVKVYSSAKISGRFAGHFIG